MALPQWTVISGKNHSLGTINERSTVELEIPLASFDGVTITVIAGSLPPGLRIENNKIIGVPFEVNRSRDFEFTLRASTSEGIADRTFSINVEGYDAPLWQTPEGLLNIGVKPSGQYWVDTVNTDWGLFATNGTTTFTKQDVTVYEGIPSRSEGTNGDFAFVLEQSYFWFKANDRWHKFTRTNIQRELGVDQDLFVGSTVPNPNIIDFWLNTNKKNNGLDIKLKTYDANIPSWLPVDYTISQSAPVTPGNDAVWIQTFESNLSLVFKIFNASENNWEILDYEYGRVPPDRKTRAYFILDNSLVDFQLQALDTDLATGEKLKYYIGDDGGELPPGLTLSEDGRITGIVDPLLALDQNVEPGYDQGRYDTGLFDFGLRDDFGYDSYFYDTAFYGYSIRTRRPKKLNRRYQFVVTVADEVSESKREFGIYVVGDDFVRADNTIMQAGTGIFTADNTYLRNPIWLTPGNLGYRRAHNYVTLYLDVYDPNTLIGTISYILKDYNDDGTPSILPPGLALDSTTGEVAGRVPYQPAVSKEYRFTVEALRQEGDFDVQDEFVATIYEDTLPGRSEIKTDKQTLSLTGGVRDINILIGQSVLIDQNPYTINSVDKTNKNYDLLRLDRPLEPVGNIKALKIIKNATIGDDSFYVTLDSLSTEAQRVFWRERTLNYSSTESYEINLLQEYVSLSVQNESGNSIPLEFNYDAASGLIDPPLVPETPANALGRYIAEQIRSLGADPSAFDIEVTPNADGSVINLIVPAFPLTRNRNLIKALFHFDDSSGVDVLYGNSIVSDSLLYRVVLNANLQRNLSKNTQISIGAIGGTTIRQRVTVANVETVSTIKTFTVNLLGEVESTITWLSLQTLPNMVANRISYLKLEAETSVVGANLKYNLIKGELPFGLELKSDGEVVGKPNQFSKIQVKYKGLFKTNTTYYYNDLVRVDNTYYRCVKTFAANNYFTLDNDEYWEEYTLVDNDKGLTFIDRTYNPWIVGYSYAVGDTVEYAEVKYKCIQAHISTVSTSNADRPDYDTAGLYWTSDVTTQFDGSTTKFDRKFVFAVLARDRFGFSATAREFTINLIDVDDKVYSNVYMQPFIKLTQRQTFNSFINDYTIFTPEYIYRPSDTNFGLQKNLRTLAYAGIEQKRIDSFVAAAARNHKKKRFKFGELKTAIAKQPGTNDIIYEVVYVDIVDPQEPTNGKTALSYNIKTNNTIKANQVKIEIKDDASAQEAGLDFFRIRTRSGDIIQIRAVNNSIPVVTRLGSVVVPAAGNIQIVGNDGSITVIVSQGSITSSSDAPYRFRPQQPVITADSNAYKVSQNKDDIRYITNISNMRQRISEIGANERQYLPLWMRTSQDGNIQEIDYVTAMPICYCKPGTSTLIKENIENAGFNFNVIDYEIDRYIVDSTNENQNEQFVLFANYKFNV